MSSKIFFTSDLHLNHYNIIKYSNRPFNNLEQMNSKIIANWNSKVSQNDTVYILGDYIWRIQKDCSYLNSITKKLNGIKYLIRGNHDRYSNYQYINAGFQDINDIGKINIQFNNTQYYFILCHYSMRFWDRSHLGSYCLFGHQHFKRKMEFDLFKQLQMSTRTMNVCLDGNNLFPYSLEQVLKQIQNNPTNFVSR